MGLRVIQWATGSVGVAAPFRDVDEDGKTQARPQASVFAVDPANPYRTLEVRGDVTIAPDPDLATLAAVVNAYGTTLDNFAGPLDDRVSIRLYPTRVVTQG